MEVHIFTFSSDFLLQLDKMKENNGVYVVCVCVCVCLPLWSASAFKAELMQQILKNRESERDRGERERWLSF